VSDDFLNRPRHAGTTKEKSVKQEKRLAKELNGRTTPGSGSGSIKGDVLTREELVEAKTTAKSQYTLKFLDLRELELNADRAGKRPVFIIEVENESTVFLFNREWVVIPKNDYLALKEGV
jgi:hypothetical protein